MHIQQAQHWTYCGLKVRLLPREEVLSRADLRKRVREVRGCPPEVCVACYRRWREASTRRY